MGLLKMTAWSFGENDEPRYYWDVAYCQTDPRLPVFLKPSPIIRWQVQAKLVLVKFTSLRISDITSPILPWYHGGRWFLWKILWKIHHLRRSCPKPMEFQGISLCPSSNLRRESSMPGSLAFPTLSDGGAELLYKWLGDWLVI